MSNIDLIDYESVKNYLYGLKYHGAKYGIDRMVLLAEALNHPEQQFPIIHVAGTNGKGSTCAMLEAIYRKGGYKTGMFTSPHLVFQGERIQIDRRPLNKDTIVHYTRQLREVAEHLGSRNPDNHPSFFEFMTGMAFLQFAQEKVEIGIFETGLGGLLDATNVVNPVVSVITSIGLDHTSVLGHTISVITEAKAGIIKENTPVVIGYLPPEAEKVIRRVAVEKKASVFSVREHIGQEYDLSSLPETNLEGIYQRHNAATASLTVKVLTQHLAVQDNVVAEALKSVFWPGRWERHQLNDRVLIMDTSHNSQGAIMLDQHLANLFNENGCRPVVAVGVLGKERAEALFPVIAKYAREIVLLKPSQPRATGFKEMESCIPGSFTGKISQDKVAHVFPGPGLCKLGQKGDTVIATGSIYLMGEIMEALYHGNMVGEHILQD